MTTTPDKKNESDTPETLRTTDTMREKAQFVSKLFIAALKCLRLMKCTKSSIKEQKAIKKVPTDV